MELQNYKYVLKVLETISQKCLPSDLYSKYLRLKKQTILPQPLQSTHSLKYILQLLQQIYQSLTEQHIPQLNQLKQCFYTNKKLQNTVEHNEVMVWLKKIFKGLKEKYSEIAGIKKENVKYNIAIKKKQQQILKVEQQISNLQIQNKNLLQEQQTWISSIQQMNINNGIQQNLQYEYKRLLFQYKQLFQKNNKLEQQLQKMKSQEGSSNFESKLEHLSQLIQSFQRSKQKQLTALHSHYNGLINSLQERYNRIVLQNKQLEKQMMFYKDDLQMQAKLITDLYENYVEPVKSLVDKKSKYSNLVEHKGGMEFVINLVNKLQQHNFFLVEEVQMLTKISQHRYSLK